MNKNKIILLSFIVGVGLGFVFFCILKEYLSTDSEGFLWLVGIFSLIPPLATVAQEVLKNIRKKGKELFVHLFRSFAFAVLCVSSSLMIAAITSTILYCAYGTCSEFSGLEILWVLEWIPIMTIVTAILSLSGLCVFWGLKRMKKIFDLRSTLVLILGMLVFGLHHFVFLNGDASEIAVIMSFVDEAYDLPGVEIDQRLRPNYLHPFRPVTFIYYTDNNEEIVEEAKGIFSKTLVTIKGDPKKYIDAYFNSSPEGIYARPFVSYDYANGLFFILQYFLIAHIFILVTNNPISRHLTGK